MCLFLVYESSGSLTDKIIETGNGNVYHDMGMFDECIAVVNPSFQGKYCTVFFHQNKMKIINQSETEEQDINNSNNQGEPVENMSNFVKPSVAFCIPSSCTASDLRSAVANRLRHRLNLPSLVSVTSEDFCYTRDKIKADSKFGIGGIFTMYLKDNR